jgi:hypothetical protein
MNGAYAALKESEPPAFCSCSQGCVYWVHGSSGSEMANGAVMAAGTIQTLAVSQVLGLDSEDKPPA